MLPLLAQLVSAQFDINDKAVGVQLFQWPFRDIARECTEFLGPNGYSFVQTSPVQAHIDDPKDGQKLPWYIMYQPVGYNIGNRLGTEADFRYMVDTCRNAGVDIVVDVVLNHNSYVNIQSSKSFGSVNPWTGSQFGESFPDAGYTAEHYHDNVCNGDIDWNNDFSVYNCRLAKLVDLKTEHPYVRSKIIEFLNKLTSYGVVGFRVDAAKCIPLSDWQAITSGLNKNYRGNKPYVAWEIFYAFGSDGTYKNYQSLGRVTNFDYGSAVGRAFRNVGGFTTDQLVNTLNSQQLPGYVSQTFVENHDKERDVDGNNNYALSQVNGGWWYKQAVAFNILYPYGIPVVHSGFKFVFNGPEPAREVPVTAPYDAATGLISSIPIATNNTCGNGWLCQHRYSDVYPLARVRTFMGKGLNAPVTVISAGRNQIYWSVAGRGFVAINSAQGGGTTEDMIVSLSTGLKQGTYCNMVYARNVNGKCVLWPGVTLTKEQVAYTVDASGKTTVRLLQSDKSRVLALYADTDGYLEAVVPTSTVAPPSAATVSFKVSHDAGFGDSVYVVGTFNSWDACNPVKCNWSTGNVWQCGPISLTPGTVYQWKAVQYGTKTGTTCKNPVWQAGNNNQFTASANLVASTAY
ncbi:glycoside hydrolase superfamily [Gorgonomyces haynaldii]|nr:glycoside hydrolase superfamily [Gorgonomyces haynaldii]